MRIRGSDEVTGSLCSDVDLKVLIPARHTSRKIRAVVNDARRSLDGAFDRLHAREGRPSIAQERLIRASLLQILYSLRSERQLMEQRDYSLLFHWFVGLGIDDAVWVPTVFSKNRDLLLTTDMSRMIMAAILAQREVAPLLSDDHFSVDGTLVKARTLMKRFQPKVNEASSTDDDPGDPPDDGASPTSSPDRSTADPEPMIRPKTPQPQRRSRFPGGSGAQTRPMRRLPIPRHGCSRRRPAQDPCCVTGVQPDREPLRSDLAGRPDAGEWPRQTPCPHRHCPGSIRRLTPSADRGDGSADFLPICARSWRRRMSPRNPVIPPSRADPPGTLVTPNPSGAGRRWRTPSAGLRL